MMIGIALVLALTSALNWRRCARCTSCTPNCPNKHQHEIAGSQGMFAASTLLLIASILEQLL